MNVLIFGLGLHGGGASAARYFLNRGCSVCITDLKTEKELAEPLDSIFRTTHTAAALTLHLGRHRIDDFIKADLVIKNTAAPPSHPLLLHAERWETDLSYFLKRIHRPIAGVTGTKGKSSTAQILYTLLSQFYQGTDIAGNMGISLFDIIDSTESCKVHQQTSSQPIVIEFSSWQLRDLRQLNVLPECRTALVTSLYPDHMNSYGSFQAYLSDKAYLAEHSENVIMSRQAKDVFNQHDFQFHKTAIGPPHRLVYAEDDADSAKLAAVCAETFIESDDQFSDADRREIRNRILQKTAHVPSLPFRLQHIGHLNNMLFINDSASTIPESILFGIRKIREMHPERIIHLICGGTDKNLEPNLYSEIAAAADHLYLLPGSFTRKLRDYFSAVSYADYWYNCIYDCCCGDQASETMLEHILMHIVRTFGTELNQAVLFSPGAASFEYFPNSDERGKRFSEAVSAVISGSK